MTQGPATSVFAEGFACLASGWIGGIATLQGVRGRRFGVTQRCMGRRRTGREQGMALFCGRMLQLDLGGLGWDIFLFFLKEKKHIRAQVYKP